MSGKAEQKRADAHTDSMGYMATIESIEPNVHPIDASAFYASAAISLKRIADVAEKQFELLATTTIKNYGAREKDMREWAHRHGFGDLWDKASS